MSHSPPTTHEEHKKYWDWMLMQQSVSIDPYQLKKGKLLCVVVWHDMDFKKHEATSSHGLFSALDAAMEEQKCLGL